MCRVGGEQQKPPTTDFSQVKHWDRNAALQTGNVWHSKSKLCPGFDSDRFWCETGRLVRSYRVLTGSVWTYLVLRGAYMKLNESRISNTTTRFCFSFHRNDEPTESSGDMGVFKQANIAKPSLKYEQILSNHKSKSLLLPIFTSIYNSYLQLVHSCEHHFVQCIIIAYVIFTCG